MDLPTCPSCGQSVLDDDARDCPFCGAAMDGSSRGKKPKAEAPEKKKPATAAKEETREEDPFAIQQSPSAAKAIPCARRPIKSRKHRVVCPMCEAEGYVPRAAFGKQVRCANKQCMVPVFTAVEEGADKAVAAPSRISDVESPVASPVAATAGTRNPMIMYGVVAGVLIALTVGLVMWLNQGGPDQIGPADIVMPSVDDDNEDPILPVDEDKPKPVTDHRADSVAMTECIVFRE